MTRVRKKKISSPFKNSKNFQELHSSKNVPKSILIFAHAYSLYYISPHVWTKKKSRSPYIYTLLNNSLPIRTHQLRLVEEKDHEKKKPPLETTSFLTDYYLQTLPRYLSSFHHESPLPSPPLPFLFPPFFFRLTSSWRKEQHNRESRTRIFHGARNSRVTTCV